MWSVLNSYPSSVTLSRSIFLSATGRSWSSIGGLALGIYFFHKCMEVLVAVDAAAPQS